MSSFAKAQLLKYGWTEGKGLGKNENGIINAIKPKLKFDNKGIGHNDKEFKWWESVYDEASNNIQIDSSKKTQEISMSIKKVNAVEISTKKPNRTKLRKNENIQYSNFLKTCTLDNGTIVKEENFVKSGTKDDDEDTAMMELTDEQLFQACGGRTAHKGARHGLALNGKLARIARQEAELLGNLNEEVTNQGLTEAEIRRKRYKRKRRRSVTEIDKIVDDAVCKDANANDLETFPYPVVDSDLEIRKKSKKSHRKEKRRFHALASQLNAFSIIDDKLEPKKKAKGTKFSNEKRNDVSEIPVINLEDDSDDRESLMIKKSQSSETERLNYRIEKKKRKALAKSEKKRVERISESLMAVNLSEDSIDSGNPSSLIYEEEVSKKMKKRRRKKEIGKMMKTISSIEVDG